MVAPVQPHGGDVYRLAFLEALRPPLRLTVSEWADRYRKLDSKTSAEAGDWRTERTPYLREIMDALSPSHPCRQVTFAKGSQIGGTEAGNNWLGFVIHHDPGPFLYVTADEGLAERTSKTRLDPMIAASPPLRDRVSSKRGRHAGNSKFEKDYPGGVLIIAGARAPAALRSTPVRYLMLDELDAYLAEIGSEGDPERLAERATRGFPNRKVLKVSTPLVEGRSRIMRNFQRSDRSRFYVPCPHCGHLQVLVWARIHYTTTADEDGAKEVKPGTTFYSCERCDPNNDALEEHAIHEHHKPAMLAGGKWIAERPERSSRHRGFHLSALYSPLGLSWENCAELWIEAQGKPAELQAFVNQVLGETWREVGDAPEWEELYRRREEYEIGKVPHGGLLLTCGVDVQGDRLEAEVVAWGRGLESWSVGYYVLPGDPAQAAVWQDLERLRERSWPAEVGPDRRIRLLAIDSGYSTQEVYRWAREHTPGQVIACKGREGLRVLVGIPRPVDVTYAGRRLRRGIKLWPVGTDDAKGQLYGWLRRKPPLHPEASGWPPGWCHFPQYGEEYFRQLCAEHLTRKPHPRGYTVYQWEKTRERNEVLDCRVLARAAAAVLGLDRLDPEQWDVLQAEVEGPGLVEPDPTAAATPAPRTPKRKRPGYFDRSRYE